MDKIQALHSFWSGFGLTAYDETSVPDNAQLPYITYQVSSDDFGNLVLLSASLWYRSRSWAEITEKEQEIASYITRGGRMLKYESGALWVHMRSPWAQRLADDSNYDLRRIVLNVAVEFLD